MKKWIIRMTIAAVVLLVAGLALTFIFLNSIVKKGVETIGPQLTQVEVRLNRANISPFSGDGQLDGLVVGNPPGYKTPSAIQVGEVKVKVEIGSLLSDVIVLDFVNIQSPEITLEGGLKQNNLTKILENLDAATGEAEKKTTEKPAPAGKKIKVKDLVISGAKARVNMTLTGGKTVTVSVPDIHLTNIGADENGVSPAELSQRIIKAMLEGVVKSAGDVGGVFGKETGEQIKKAGKGLKGLFKK